MEGILNTHLLDMTLCKEIRDGTFGLKTTQSVLEPTDIHVPIQVLHLFLLYIVTYQAHPV